MFIQKQIQQVLKQNNLDILLIQSECNRFWYSQYTSSEGLIIVSKTKSILVVDGRYYENAMKAFSAKKIKNIDEVVLSNFTYLKSGIAKFTKIKNVGFESDYITYNDFTNLQNSLPNTKLIGIEAQNWRMIKTDDEISKMKKACAIGDKTIAQVLPKIKAGMTEKEIANLIEFGFKANGAQKPSFDTIVAFGANAAMPHARVTDTKLKVGDIILIDSGCFYQNYCSDMTRTFMFKKTNKKLEEAYNVVLKAQLLGVASAKPGMKCSQLDKIVRDSIIKDGYGEFFIHGTGHSLGIEIHENPRVRATDHTVLKENMVVTIEPGVYLPGLGGIRIEDDVLITKNGCQPLNKTPKKFTIIK